MTIFQGILLGLLQGIAEFLPISSSGHLAIAQHLFGLGEIPLLFDVFLHLATLCSVVLFFRKKIWALLCAFGRLIARRPAPLKTKDLYGKEVELTQEEAVLAEKNWRTYILAIILATLVTGVIGIVTEKCIGELPLRFVCAGFIFTSILLVLSSIVEKKRSQKITEEHTQENKSPSWWQALLIGLWQGIGTLPGVSRSGSTISGGLFCGVNRAVAGEFSFIVSIPAILGAFILELKDLGEVGTSVGVEPVLAGCFAAFASGYIALTWLMKLIKKGKLEWFACYLIPAGILGLIFLG